MLFIVPADPEHVPFPASREKARHHVVLCMPTAGAVTETLTECVRFFGSNTSLMRVACPVCKRNVDERWWNDAKASAEAGGGLAVTMPCCRTRTKLSLLDYEPEGRFSRFAIAVKNPQSVLGCQQIDALAAILECPIREVWVEP